MQIRWHGTAAVEIQSNNTTILFDPFVPVAPSPTPAKLEDFDGYDTVLITHGHFDHIASLPEIAKRNPNMNIYCTGTPYRVLQKKGIPVEQLICFHIGETMQFGNIQLETYHGKHAVLPRVSAARIRYAWNHPGRRNLPALFRENWICRENDETVFYRLSAEGKTVSLMGSMNLREETSYPVDSDVLVLPYNGWEDNLPPAIRCIERLQPKTILLDHYDDTFPPLTMPLDLSPIINRYPGKIATMEYNRWIVL